MVSRSELERRNRLAYLALYYAIQGEEERSEQIRRLVRQEDQMPERRPAYAEPAAV